MQTDTNLLFVGGNTGSALSITSSAVASTGILDLSQGTMNTGTTYSNDPMTTGSSSYFAEDLGNGPWRLNLSAFIGTAFAGGTSLNIAFQGAPDASGGSYPANLSGLTWTTYAETGAIPLANINVANSQIFLPDWPHRLIKAAMPRFIRLYFTPVGTFSAGTIVLAGVFMGRPDFDMQNYPGGFAVGS